MKSKIGRKMFIGNSSQSITLRNELRPIGKTQENIEKNGILLEDDYRAKKREELKQIMDDYYRTFLEKSLCDFKIEWNDLFVALENISKDKATNAELSKIQAEKRKLIFQRYKEQEEFRDLFSAKMITDILPDFVKKNKEYTDQEKEEKLEVIELFSRFTSAFTEYFKNRENIFTADAIPTSSCYRVVNVNADIFYENRKAFQHIQKDVLEEIKNMERSLNEDLSGWELKHIFTNEYYGYLITQQGIDYYNRICAAINSHMNLYCQRNQLNRSRYNMRKLKKQILSVAVSGFKIPEKYESDQELYDNVNFYLAGLRELNLGARLISLSDKAESYQMKRIYISSKYYSKLSIFMQGDWSLIENCLTEFYSQTIRAGVKTKEEKVKKAVKEDKYKSLEEIDELLLKYADRQEEYKSAKEYIHTIKELAGKLMLEEIVPDDNTKLIENVQKKQELKEVLDGILNVAHWMKQFLIEDHVAQDEQFYSELNALYDEVENIIPIYNRVRNYVTQRPYSIEKMKLNFGVPTLADGWSKSKEYDNNAVLFIRNEKFYLGIFNANNKPEKRIMEGNAHLSKESDYKKVVYFLLPGPNKMLPKVFISSKTGLDTYHPSKYILDGYRSEKHKKGSKNFDIQYCHDLIDFFKDCIEKHPEWKNYGFRFSETKTYADISEFYKEVADQGYRIDYSFIPEKDVNRLIDEGKLYLFQIYNKDFADGKTGTDNLHTMYLKNLFSEENLRDVVLKLNGQAELFYRKSSIQKPIVHKKGSILVNRTYKDVYNGNKRVLIPENIYQELYNYYNHKCNKLSEQAKEYTNKVECHEAPIDIVKDRRFTVDKYFFHCPITINFKASGRENVNDIALRYIAQEDVNIIGIDRGERNLIYVSVVDPKGRILEQKSFNIVNDYDYKEKLKEKEKDRQAARQNWETIGKIKEIKEGYLSSVIHEITQLIIKYNAIIVMEDLNYGFKRGRFKVERQVYQKFESMLISKLHYLVDKSIPVDQEGGLLRGYQMSYIPDNMDRLGRQCGTIFFIPPAYTSKIDPTTGFVNVFKHRELTSGAAKKEFLCKFDDISYDPERDMFRFAFDYRNFSTHRTQLAKTRWEVYSNGERVHSYRKEGRWKEEIVEPTQMLKRAFDNVKIDYSDGHNLVEGIRKLDERKDLEIIKELQFAFILTVSMRNSIKDNDEYDRIISPILNEDGEFFDSFEAEKNYANACFPIETAVNTYLPIDADANGAFHIALKGLYLVEQIKKNWIEGQAFNRNLLKIDNATWFDYVQNKKYKD